MEVGGLLPKGHWRVLKKAETTSGCPTPAWLTQILLCSWFPMVPLVILVSSILEQLSCCLPHTTEISLSQPFPGVGRASLPLFIPGETTKATRTDIFMISFSLASLLSRRVLSTQHVWQIFAEGLKTHCKNVSWKKKVIENVFKCINTSVRDSVHTSLFPTPKSLLAPLSKDRRADVLIRI